MDVLFFRRNDSSAPVAVADLEVEDAGEVLRGAGGTGGEDSGHAGNCFTSNQAPALPAQAGEAPICLFCRVATPDQGGGKNGEH